MFINIYVINIYVKIALFGQDIDKPRPILNVKWNNWIKITRTITNNFFMGIKTTEKWETNSDIMAITATKITITNNKNRIKHEQLHCLGQFVSLPHTALPQGRGEGGTVCQLAILQLGDKKIQQIQIHTNTKTNNAR